MENLKSMQKDAATDVRIHEDDLAGTEAVDLKTSQACQDDGSSHLHHGF